MSCEFVGKSEVSGLLFTSNNWETSNMSVQTKEGGCEGKVLNARRNYLGKVSSVLLARIHSP